MVKTEQLTYQIGQKTILHKVSLACKPGQITMILGPNGSGKSSLLRILSGDIRSFEGGVEINDASIRGQKPADLAKFRAVMSQQPHLEFPLSVEDVIMMGRYPFFGTTPSAKDRTICQDLIQKLELQAFLKRNYTTLSGGEKQRVQFARVLAQVWEQPVQGCRYLFLDEPLNSLDIRYQQAFLKVAASMLDNRTVVVAILHDINLALKFGDAFIFLKNGRVEATGDPSIVTGDLILKVFEVKATVLNNAKYPYPFVVIS